MAYLLMAVGMAMALLALWRALAGGGDESRRRGRSTGAAQDRSGSGAEVAAGLDPGDPRAAAWAVLREPVQVEPELLDLIARRPPARQFRIGTLLGFGLGLAVAGGLWLLAQGLGWAEPPRVAQGPGPGGQGAATGEVGGEASSGYRGDLSGPGTGGGAAGGETTGGGAGGVSGTPPSGGGDSPTSTGAGENPGGGAATGTGDEGHSGAPAGGGASGQQGTGDGTSGQPGTGGSTGQVGTGGTGAGIGAAPEPGTLVTVVIDPGMTAPQIAARLREKGLIADEAAFLARLAERGMDTRLQAGTFQVPAGASLDQVIDRLAGM